MVLRGYVRDVARRVTAERQSSRAAIEAISLVLGLQRASDPLPRPSDVFEHEAMFGEFGSRRHFTALSDFGFDFFGV